MGYGANRFSLMLGFTLLAAGVNANAASAQRGTFSRTYLDACRAKTWCEAMLKADARYDSALNSTQRLQETAYRTLLAVAAVEFPLSGSRRICIDNADSAVFSALQHRFAFVSSSMDKPCWKDLLNDVRTLRVLTTDESSEAKPAFFLSASMSRPGVTGWQCTFLRRADRWSADQCAAEVFSIFRAGCPTPPGAIHFDTTHVDMLIGKFQLTFSGGIRYPTKTQAEFIAGPLAEKKIFEGDRKDSDRLSGTLLRTSVDPNAGIYTGPGAPPGSMPRPVAFSNGALVVGCRLCTEAQPDSLFINWVSSEGFGGVWRESYGAAFVLDNLTGERIPRDEGAFCAKRTNN